MDENRWVVQHVAPLPVKAFSVLDAADGLHEEPFYVVMGFAPSRYGVALMARASRQQVENVAQHGGMCAVMVSAKALHGTTEVVTPFPISEDGLPRAALPSVRYPPDTRELTPELHASVAPGTLGPLSLLRALIDAGGEDKGTHDPRRRNSDQQSHDEQGEIIQLDHR